jgi:hypothetical protein
MTGMVTDMSKKAMLDLVAVSGRRPLLAPQVFGSRPPFRPLQRRFHGMGAWDDPDLALSLSTDSAFVAGENLGTVSTTAEGAREARRTGRFSIPLASGTLSASAPSTSAGLSRRYFEGIKRRTTLLRPCHHGTPLILDKAGMPAGITGS